MRSASILVLILVLLVASSFPPMVSCSATDPPAGSVESPQHMALRAAEGVFYRQHSLRYSMQLRISYYTASTPPSGGGSVAFNGVYSLVIQNKTVQEFTHLSGSILSPPSATGVPASVINTTACILEKMSVEKMFEIIARNDPLELDTAAVRKVSYNWQTGAPELMAVFCNKVSVTLSVVNVTVLSSDQTRNMLQQTLDKNRNQWRNLNWKFYNYILHKSCKPFCPSGVDEFTYIVSVDHNRIIGVWDKETKEEVKDRLTAVDKYKTIEGYFLEADRAIDFAELSSLRVQYNPEMGFISYLSYHSATGLLTGAGTSTASTQLQLRYNYDTVYVKISNVYQDVYTPEKEMSKTVLLIIVCSTIAVLAIVGFGIWRYRLSRRWGNLARERAKARQGKAQPVPKSEEDAAKATGTSPGPSTRAGVYHHHHEGTAAVDYGLEEEGGVSPSHPAENGEHDLTEMRDVPPPQRSQRPREVESPHLHDV